MKVCHLLLSLDPKYGGPTFSIPIQCIGAKSMGADMSILLYDTNKPYEKKLIENDINLIEIQHPRNSFERFFSIQLKKYLKTTSKICDIFHTHGVWRFSCIWVAQFCRRVKIPYVINPRGDLEVYRINRNKYKKIKKELAWLFYAKKNVQEAACIIATSQQEAKAIRLRGITTPIAIIPNGIDISSFPALIEHKPNEKKVLLFLSRVNPIKGLELLIEAWKELPTELKNTWELHIVGNSDPIGYDQQLKKIVHNYKLEESIKFLGPLKGKEKENKYLSSDLFILPTFNENFGNVIAESMMYECPVITTKNAPWDCIEKESCGWWIDLSVDNLVSSMKEAMLLSDEDRWELGRKSRKCVIDYFSSDNVARKTYELYQWVLGLTGQPDFVQTGII